MGRPCRRRGAADVQRSVPAAGPLGRRHPDVSARGCLAVVYSPSRGRASAIQESARSAAGQRGCGEAGQIAMTELFAELLIAWLATVVMAAVELATTGVKRLLGHRGAVGRQEPPRASGAPGGPVSQRLTAPPAAPHAPSSRNA